MTDKQTTYHEIDFLMTAQRFKIDFSYITEKGLSFYREYVLRLIHLAPMSKNQIAIYMGFSRHEVDEAVDDLVERGEIFLSLEGRLKLTDKSKAYFSDFGDAPKLASVMESQAMLCFDLTTFTCLGRNSDDKWKNGIQVKTENNNVSQSQLIAEKKFQEKFNDILKKGYLPSYLRKENKELPSLYTVDSVIKLRQFPVRLNTNFKIDGEGKSVEREDYEELDSSDLVHEAIAKELASLSRMSNIMNVFRAMSECGDEETQKIFNSDGGINLKYLEDLNKLEEHQGDEYTTFVGPIYAHENTVKLYKYLTPILAQRVSNKSENHNNKFRWIAPSDPFWGKSHRFGSSISEFIHKAKVSEKNDRKAKNIYDPILYVPLVSSNDTRGAKQWKNNLAEYGVCVKGLREGFLGGSVEVLHLENSLVVVVYHISYPNDYPVTLPIGFITTIPKIVDRIGNLVAEYIEGFTGLEHPNDFGYIDVIVK